MNKRSAFALALLVAISSAAGGWYAARYTRHEHVLVKGMDEAGKVYWTCTMHPQVRIDHPGTCPICGMTLIERTDAPASDARAASAEPSAGERRVLYWYDPMKPDQHFDKPGRSPYMDMALVPKYADAQGSDESGGTIVTIDPRMAQNLGMRTASARMGRIAPRLQLTGTVTIDERRITVVEARAAGWVERLDVRAVGDVVRAGQTVAAIYAPDLRAAQQELALAKKLNDATLIDAARSRLRLLGVGDADGATPLVAITAARAGVVTELLVRQGAQVAPGVPLLELADLSSVWMLVEVPEAQAAGLGVGNAVEARFLGLPDKTFTGMVDYVYPTLDAKTRTVRARLVFANGAGELRPGMYAQVSLAGTTGGDTVLVPTEAVIRTGTRDVVLLADGDGRYRPVQVVLGREQGDETEVVRGVDPGQRVVVSGQFLIDSEANLLGAFRRMDRSDADAESPAAMTRNMGGGASPGAYEAAPKAENAR